MSDLILKSGFNSLRLTNQANTVILRATGALVSNQATGATYTAQYDEVYPVTFYIVPDTQALDEISVRISEAFDGTGATLKIGDLTISDRFFTTTETDLTEGGVTFQKGFDDEGEISLSLTIDPGTGASQGEVLIQVSTTKKGV